MTVKGVVGFFAAIVVHLKLFGFIKLMEMFEALVRATSREMTAVVDQGHGTCELRFGVGEVLDRHMLGTLHHRVHIIEKWMN